MPLYPSQHSGTVSHVYIAESVSQVEHGVGFGVGFGVGCGVGFGVGRGVGLTTLAPISQLAAERAVGVTTILSARNPKLVMSTDVFQRVGADLVTITDSDGSSATNNVESIIESLISDGRADAFFVCGSNRLLLLMKKLGKKHGIPGQVAMEQIMACGLGPCYICVRTFEVDGKNVLRRVCKDGPVFDMQEAVAW